MSLMIYISIKTIIVLKITLIIYINKEIIMISYPYVMYTYLVTWRILSDSLVRFLLSNTTVQSFNNLKLEILASSPNDNKKIVFLNTFLVKCIYLFLWFVCMWWECEIINEEVYLDTKINIKY